MKSPSIKKIEIDKDSRSMIIWVAIASFIVIFCSISSYSEYKNFSYQNKIINADNNAKTTLLTDIGSSNSLIGSYKNFVNTSTNIIGGNTNSNSQNNGDNAKIILDALPSSYDYPALISSLQNLLVTQGASISSITGSDTPPGSGNTSLLSSSSPVTMPFGFTVTGNYQTIQNVINAFEHSIRPMQFMTVDISGNQSSLTLTVTAQTFYQPAVGFNITKETIN